MDSIFYILFSERAQKYYVGHTTGPIEERVRKHNSNHKGFTGKFQDWKVVHTERYVNKQQAYARERAVKKWKSKARTINLIAGLEHPG